MLRHLRLLAVAITAASLGCHHWQGANQMTNILEVKDVDRVTVPESLSFDQIDRGPITTEEIKARDGQQVHYSVRILSGEKQAFEQLGVSFEKPCTLFPDEQTRAIGDAIQGLTEPSSKFKVEVLLAPQLTAFSEQEARIAVVTELQYVAGFEFGNEAPVRSVATCEEGVNLLIKGRVDGTNVILEKLQPTLSSILGIRTCRGTLRLAGKNHRVEWEEPVLVEGKTAQPLNGNISVKDGSWLALPLVMSEVKQMASDARAFVVGGKVKERYRGRKLRKGQMPPGERPIVVLMRVNILIRDEMKVEKD